MSKKVVKRKKHVPTKTESSGPFKELEKKDA
jgi:hypothetical protein